MEDLEQQIRIRTSPHLFTKQEDQQLKKIMDQINRANQQCSWRIIAEKMREFGFNVTGHQCRSRWKTKIQPCTEQDLSNWNKQEMIKVLDLIEDIGPLIQKISNKMDKKTPKQIKVFISSFLRKGIDKLEYDMRIKLNQKIYIVRTRQFRCIYNMILTLRPQLKQDAKKLRQRLFKILKKVSFENLNQVQIRQTYKQFIDIRQTYFIIPYKESCAAKIDIFEDKYDKFNKQQQQQLYYLYCQHGKNFSKIADKMRQAFPVYFDKYSYENLRQHIISMLRDGVKILAEITQKRNSKYTKLLKNYSNRLTGRILIGLNTCQSLPIKAYLLQLKVKKQLKVKYIKCIIHFLKKFHEFRIEKRKYLDPKDKVWKRKDKYKIIKKFQKIKQ